MNARARSVVLVVLAAGSLLLADEKLPRLELAGESYSNVTVTKITDTDIYFLHARGFGSGKLKDLEPALQKHFGYNPTKAAEIEKGRAEGNVQFRQRALTAVPPPVRPAPENDQPQSASGEDGDIVVPTLHARSFRGERAPELTVERWLTGAPDTTGKFVLIDFWATWCGPCRQSIPHLNSLHARFKDRLVVIGLSDELEADILAMRSPKIDYCIATDTQKRMLSTVQVKGIPHAMLIDPKGIVRFEGMPGYLDAGGLERLLAKYAN